MIHNKHKRGYRCSRSREGHQFIRFPGGRICKICEKIVRVTK